MGDLPNSEELNKMEKQTKEKWENLVKEMIAKTSKMVLKIKYKK